MKAFDKDICELSSNHFACIAFMYNFYCERNKECTSQ